MKQINHRFNWFVFMSHTQTHTNSIFATPSQIKNTKKKNDRKENQ